jgi:ketosteroid isomerase-like protein
MHHNPRTRYGLIAIGAALSLAAGLAGSADRNDVREGIQATIDKTNALQKRNAPGREIAAALFEDDLMITGEGESKGYNGLASFIDTFVRLSAGAANCDLKLIDPIRSSGNLASAFVSQHCTASKAGEKGEDSRVLFVFRKGAKGWRVTMGHWSGGKF